MFLGSTQLPKVWIPETLCSKADFWLLEKAGRWGTPGPCSHRAKSAGGGWRLPAPPAGRRGLCTCRTHGFSPHPRAAPHTRVPSPTWPPRGRLHAPQHTVHTPLSNNTHSALVTSFPPSRTSRILADEQGDVLSLSPAYTTALNVLGPTPLGRWGQELKHCRHSRLERFKMGADQERAGGKRGSRAKKGEGAFWKSSGSRLGLLFLFYNSGLKISKCIAQPWLVWLS